MNGSQQAEAARFPKKSIINSPAHPTFSLGSFERTMAKAEPVEWRQIIHIYFTYIIHYHCT